MRGEADYKAEYCGADPAEAERGEREMGAHEVHHALQMHRADDIGGKTCAEIIDSGDKSDADGPAIDALVIIKESAEKGEENKYDRQRVEEHQHGKREADNLVQAEVCEAEGDEAENARPSAIAQAFEELRERFGAACDESDRCFEAGERNGSGEDNQPGCAEIVLGYLRKGDAAVFGAVHDAAAVHADKRDEEIDNRHQNAAEDSCAYRVGCYRVPVLNAEAAYNVYDDDAEGEARKRVDRVVAFDEALKERRARVISGRLNFGDSGAGV